jgi:hypothetical protein
VIAVEFARHNQQVGTIPLFGNHAERYPD